jgi:hypothetical protein
MTTHQGPSYVAGKVDEYKYPALGDEKPPKGADVHLLTVGGICVRGPWDDKGNRYLGWAPLPKRNHEREAELLRLRGKL